MKHLKQYIATLFFEIIFNINGIEIIGQIIYDTYLNENFYLIKINKPPPNKYINIAII